MRKRIFFLHAETYMADVVPELRARGIDVVAATTRGRGTPEAWDRVLDSSAVRMFSTDARNGVVPASFRNRVRPARLADIQALAPTAARTLQMLDRMNQDGFSVTELHHVYLQMIGLWRTMIDELRPDGLVIGSGLPQFGFDHVVYQLFQADRLPIAMFRHTHIEGHALPTGRIEDVPGPSALEIEATPSVPADPEQFASPTNDLMHAQAMNLRDIRSKLSRRGVLRTLIGWRQFGRSTPTPEILHDPMPLHAHLRWHYFRGRLLSRRALLRYDSLARTPDLEQPFVYYPLPTEPEESTMPLGGAFSDTMHVLRIVSQSLPTGFRLYVKEHANQFNRMFLMSKGRNLQFYDRLAELPNVTVVPLEFPSKQLIARAKAVTLVAGTTGWEALQLGIPAIVFGYPWYLRCPGLMRADGIETLSDALVRIARGEQVVSTDRVRRYQQLMRERYTIPMIFATAFVPFAKISMAQHTESHASAIERTLRSGEAQHAQVVAFPS